MRQFRLPLTVLLLICALQPFAFAREINVCVNVRGTTGLEPRVIEAISGEFRKLDDVRMVGSGEESQLYLDLSLVEQEQIRFYGLGISIAYHLRDEFYSRPTSDVAQFGIERMEDVCRHLAAEIDKGFLDPIREAGEKITPAQ
jgi:hypothetical protein